MPQLRCSYCSTSFWRDDKKYLQRLNQGYETFFCSRACWARYRFQKDITWEEDSNGCWVCTSHNIGDDRYPEVKQKGKTINLARHLYEEKYGAIPKGMRLIRTCRNISCINPDHMVIGTQQDVIKHRDSGEHRWKPKGEKHPGAVLKEHDVILIRRSERSYTDLAKEYGVTPQQIWRIQKGLAWAHVKDPNASETNQESTQSA